MRLVSIKWYEKERLNETLAYNEIYNNSIWTPLPYGNATKGMFELKGRKIVNQYRIYVIRDEENKRIIIFFLFVNASTF